MSLFSSIRMAANAMQASTIGLQVVGQNIANANTPGYIREEVNLAPAPTQRIGDLLLGTGVRVDSVVQKIDVFLEDRLRGAISQRSGAEAEESSYAELESLINALDGNSISTFLNQFASSIADILNQPESVSTRNMAVLQAGSLTEAINHLSAGVQTLRTDVNDRVINMADEINRLVEDIRVLNTRIADTEGGNISKSDAVGLRDQRLSDLQSLSKLINIQVQEQPSGGVVVYAGDTYLVYEGNSRKVEAVIDSEGGFPRANIQMVDTQAPLNPSAGELHGLLDVRDNVLGKFSDDLDQFARDLIYEFNKVYSSGQGLTGYDKVTSEFAVTDSKAAVDEAGLVYTPGSGSFQIITRIKATGLTTTHNITIDLDNVGQKTTIGDVVKAINNIPGMTARLNAGRLEIKSNAGQEFAFANDTSGFLAAMGINTFFKGSSGNSIGVSDTVRADPAKFAASSGGIGADTQNAVKLAKYLDLPVASKNGATLGVLYDRLTAGVTQASSIAQSTAEGARTFEETLNAQKMSISGVSLDEEAVQMIAYQRAYQASARFISVISELFDVLVNM